MLAWLVGVCRDTAAQVGAIVYLVTVAIVYFVDAPWSTAVAAAHVIVVAGAVAESVESPRTGTLMLAGGCLASLLHSLALLVVVR